MRSRWIVNLGRFAGVQVRVHASFLLLLGWVLLAGGVTSLVGAAWAIGWIVVIFACVVAHELAHCVAARHHGVTVRGIVLLPIGGMSEMDRIPDDPRAEVAIAASGPFASLLIGTALVTTSAALGQHWWPPTLNAGPLIGRLGWLNVLLAAFNLLPVLPLDGGRVVRALIERWVGPTRATVLAARVGTMGGLIFVLVGVLYDVWFILIGMFVLLGASAEGRDARVHQQLAPKAAADAMLRDPWTVRADLLIDARSLGQAIDRQGVLPVVEDQRYSGVLGPPQLPLLGRGRRAGDLSDRTAPAVPPTVDLATVLDILRRSGQPAVTIVAADGRVLGVIGAPQLRRELSAAAGSTG